MGTYFKMGEPDVFVISVDLSGHFFGADAAPARLTPMAQTQPLGGQQHHQSPPSAPHAQPSSPSPIDHRHDIAGPIDSPPPPQEEDFDLQLAEELGRIFRHYCAGGYVSFDVLPAENFYKFVRDCHMLDNLLTHDDMQSVFFELAVPPNNEVDVRHIVYEDFFSALGSLAARKYLFEDSVTAAVNNLLANNILPHACRAPADPKSDDIYAPQVLDLFALNQESLQKMFCFYKRARKWEDVVQSNGAIGAGEMGCLVHDFEIVPKYLSKHVVSKLMRVSSTTEGRINLFYPQFCECVARCALQIYSQHPFSAKCGPRAENKVEALFKMMSMDKPQELRSRLRSQPEAFRDLSGGPAVGPWNATGGLK